jgi:release factor glutamine methyltransferase
VHLGDLYAALPPRLSGQVDVLVANAPYVPTDAVALMPPEAREHEPRVALDGGPDGLDVHRRIATSAAIWLARDGVLLIEVSAAQVPTATAIFAAAALDVEVVHSDDRDATVLLGRLHRS